MLLGVALVALLSSVAWGASDFVGGVAAKRMPSPAVVAWSQGAAVVVLTVVAGIRGLPFLGPWTPYAVGAGLGGALALTSYYAALASGTMGVVAPIASLGVIVPVVVGLVAGERAGALAWVGVVIAVLGVVLASGPELSGESSGGWKPVGLACLAGLGFGITMVLLAKGSSTSVLGTLWGMRVASVVAFGLAGLVLRPAGWGNPQAQWKALLFVGLSDATANALFGFAADRGLVSLASVLGSMYPVVTIILARLVLDERLRRIQVAGVVLTMVGVGAITLG